MADAPLLLDVWVAGWEVECCRDQPATRQTWAEIVTLGDTAQPERIETHEAVVPGTDGDVTVIGTMVRRLGGDPMRAMLLQAGRLRVVLLRDGEVGRLYRAAGRLWRTATTCT
jgi:hypothetical protein